MLGVTPYFYSTDDLFGDLGCYARGMARAHDGLMMLLTVGRNRTLRLIMFYDDCYILIDGWMYHVWWMVSFTLLYLYHRFNENDVSLFLHMYILLSL